MHAVVTRSRYGSQYAQNTSVSDHFWKLRCRKSARCCGAKHVHSNYNFIATTNITTTTTTLRCLQPLLDPSVGSLCHPSFTGTNLSYSFPILKLSPPPCAVLLTTGSSRKELSNVKFVGHRTVVASISNGRPGELPDPTVLCSRVR